MQIEMSRTRWAIVILAVAAAIPLLYISWPSPKPANVQQIINDTKKELEVQYMKQVAEKETALKYLKSRLVVSEGKYKALVKKYIDLQKEKENVKPPQTNAELRDRFTALGYPPLSAK
jgi:hypothetical protein